MDKRESAAHLIMQAVELYKCAQNNIDYMQSILLAGSAFEEIEPLFNSQDKETNKKTRDFELHTYNLLKRNERLSDSEDIKFEAEEIILKVICDFNTLGCDSVNLPEEINGMLKCDNPLGVCFMPTVAQRKNRF